MTIDGAARVGAGVQAPWERHLVPALVTGRALIAVGLALAACSACTIEPQTSAPGITGSPRSDARTPQPTSSINVLPDGSIEEYLEPSTTLTTPVVADGDKALLSIGPTADSSRNLVIPAHRGPVFFDINCLGPAVMTLHVHNIVSVTQPCADNGNGKVTYFTHEINLDKATRILASITGAGGGTTWSLLVVQGHPSRLSAGAPA